LSERGTVVVVSRKSCSTQTLRSYLQKLIRDHADILSKPEWRDLGYEYVNIDDCWPEMQRDGEDRLVSDKTRFPSGMKSLSDYLHSKNLKLGTYNDMGTKTCGGYPGECKDENCTLPGYMSIDADTYAGWGIDSLKMDGCNSVHTEAILNPAYEFLGSQLNKTGRPILYSCSWPDYLRVVGIDVNYTMIAEHCNIWRMFDDIQDSFDSVTSIVDWVGDNQDVLSANQGPGAFNDPDMLIIGNYGLSLDQSRAQFALWSIMAAPLLMGNDLRNLAPEFAEILQNKEIIAVDQDSLGKMGKRVVHTSNICTATDVWIKPLQNGDFAVVMWNRGVCGSPREVTLNWSDISLPKASRYNVRDLYLHKDMGVFSSSYTTFINPAGGVAALRLSAV
jgi:alpha-N-acetylgalactosaminidase